MGKIIKLLTVMSAKAATGVGTTMPVKDFDSVVLQVSAYGTANLTLKAQGAIGETAPTFSTAQSNTNHWDYIQMVDLQSGANLPGDTGMVVAADDYRLFEINTSHLDFINCELTRTGGSCTVIARANCTGY